MILWLILVIFIGWLFWQAVVPGGQISYVYDFSRENYFINKLTPPDRVVLPAEGEQKIIGNPVYFALRTARTFDRARLTVKFRNPRNLPLIEAGVLADKTVWRYETRPLENLTLDRLEKNWTTTRVGPLALYQRQKKFDSLADFLKHTPDSAVGSYNYNLDIPVKPADYMSATSGPDPSVALRGPYQFYTYPDKGSINLKFEFIDLNENKDADPVDIKLYGGSKLLSETGLPDDGIKTGSGQKSKPRFLSLNRNNLPEGVYKIEIVANDDIVTKKIAADGHRLSFVNRLWLADFDAPVELFTDSAAVSAQTINPAALQKIGVGGRTLDLDQTYRQFTIEPTEKISRLRLERPDLILSGDGVFSFLSSGLFNPNRPKIAGRLDPDKWGIDFVIADYEPPTDHQGWRVASADFNLKDAYREFYKYNFLISVPQLNAEDKVDDFVEISEIKVDLTGTTLWEKFKKIWLRN